MAITITEAAASRVSTFLANRGKGIGLRLGVRTSGCSGMAYILEFVDELDEGDQVFEEQGVKIIVDAKSMVYLDAISAAWRAISRARSSASCNLRRYRLQPNVFVRMMSAPAATKAPCSALTLWGWSTFHSSGGSPGPSPIPKKLVPVAPSARIGPSPARSASSEVRIRTRYPCASA